MSSIKLKIKQKGSTMVALDLFPNLVKVFEKFLFTNNFGAFFRLGIIFLHGVGGPQFAA
jgi:hypothetical protein